MENRNCWYCGSKLIWQSDFDAEDLGYEGTGIVTFLSCSLCGAEVEYRILEEEE